jgi:hypothetical protein
MLTTLKTRIIGAIPQPLVYVFTMWMIVSVCLFAIQCAGSGLPTFGSFDETSLFSYIVTSILGPLSYLSILRTVMNNVFVYVLSITGTSNFFDFLVLAQTMYRQGNVDEANINLRNAFKEIPSIKWSVIATILGSILSTIARYYLDRTKDADSARSIKELSDVLNEFSKANKTLLEGAQERANQINQVVSAQPPSAQRTAARTSTAQPPSAEQRTAPRSSTTPLQTTLPSITPNFRRRTPKDLNG